MIEISIVIPCLNEEANIEICINKCFNSFKELNVIGEVIVVDNNCTDKTAEIARNMGAKVITCSDAGYGYALRAGFNCAAGNYILMADGDNTYDFNEIPKFYKTITEKQADMVTGTRIKGYIQKGAMPFLHRYIGTPFLTTVMNILHGIRISDCNCGMRIFSRDRLNHIEFKTGGMEFASELFVQFAKKKYIIEEIPISLYTTTKRSSKLNTFRDGFRHLFYLISATQK